MNKEETFYTIILVIAVFILLYFIGYFVWPMDTHCMCENRTIFTHVLGVKNMENRCIELCKDYGGGRMCPGMDLGCQFGALE